MRKRGYGLATLFFYGAIALAGGCGRETKKQ